MGKAFPGATFTEASTGEEVLLLVEQTDFDILVVDEEMDPAHHVGSGQHGLLGSETIATIRAREARGRRHRMPIVSCTADSDDPATAHRIRAAGADLIWGKPCPRSDAMGDALEMLLQGVPPAQRTEGDTRDAEAAAACAPARGDPRAPLLAQPQIGSQS